MGGIFFAVASKRHGIPAGCRDSFFFALLCDKPPPRELCHKRGVVEMRLLFKELCREGKPIILASHIAEDMDDLCDTVCEMDSGVLSVVY